MKPTLIRKTGLAAAMRSLAALTLCATATIASGAQAPEIISVAPGAKTIGESTVPAPGLAVLPMPPAPFVPRTKVDIYKQVLPNGQVIYGDAPIPGRKVEKVISVQNANVPMVWSAQYDVKTASKAPKTGLPDQGRTGADASGQNDLSSEILAAEEDFRVAEKALNEGKEPIAGERSRNANGSSRLNDAYFQRQKLLKDNLDAASNRLYDAYQAARTAGR